MTMLLDKLYNKTKSSLEIEFDMLQPSFSIFSAFSMNDFQKLTDIASSIKYSGKLKKKKEAIDNIMTARGFVKFASGTNRVVYRPVEYNDIIVKVPLDYVALTDNPAEYINQNKLKPFCSKIFETAPNGAMLSAERGRPIVHTQEFLNIASDVYNIITNCFIGKYIIADFGTKFFMNWAIFKRGPGLIDFPYVYPIDGGKLFCNFVNRDDPTRTPCYGYIDYDDGFNELVCKKCGKRYLATDLSGEDKSIKIIGGSNKMTKSNEKIVLMCGDEVILSVGGENNDIDDGDENIDLSQFVNSIDSNKAPYKYDIEEKVVIQAEGVQLVELNQTINEEYHSYFEKEIEKSPLKQVIVIEDKVLTQDEYDIIVKESDIINSGLIAPLDEVEIQNKKVVSMDDENVKISMDLVYPDESTIVEKTEVLLKEIEEEDTSIDYSKYQCINPDGPISADVLDSNEDYKKIEDIDDEFINEDELLISKLKEMVNNPNATLVKNMKKEEQNDRDNN